MADIFNISVGGQDRGGGGGSHACRPRAPPPPHPPSRISGSAPVSAPSTVSLGLSALFSMCFVLKILGKRPIETPADISSARTFSRTFCELLILPVFDEKITFKSKSTGLSVCSSWVPGSNWDGEGLTSMPGVATRCKRLMCSPDRNPPIEKDIRPLPALRRIQTYHLFVTTILINVSLGRFCASA